MVIAGVGSEIYYLTAGGWSFGKSFYWLPEMWNRIQDRGEWQVWNPNFAVTLIHGVIFYVDEQLEIVDNTDLGKRRCTMNTLLDVVIFKYNTLGGGLRQGSL